MSKVSDKLLVHFSVQKVATIRFHHQKRSKVHPFFIKKEQRTASYQKKDINRYTTMKMKLSVILIVIATLTTKRHALVDCKEIEGKNAQITSLQSWLDNQVQNKNPLVGISAFVVAGSDNNPVEVVTSGKAVIASAWDATNNRGVSNVEKAVTADSTCMLASTSKPFTWTALSMLLDAGKFDLDDAIDDVLSFQVRNPRFPNVPVTYRHLYSHTSGIKGTFS